MYTKETYAQGLSIFYGACIFLFTWYTLSTILYVVSSLHPTSNPMYSIGPPIRNSYLECASDSYLLLKARSFRFLSTEGIETCFS